jgi:hypothetical protein
LVWLGSIAGGVGGNQFMIEFLFVLLKCLSYEFNALKSLGVWCLAMYGIECFLATIFPSCSKYQVGQTRALC